MAAYLSCTFPQPRGLLQLREGAQVGALGAGVGAALLGLSEGLSQAGLSHGLHLLEGLRQKLEMDLHHREEAPTQHLQTGEKDYIRLYVIQRDIYTEMVTVHTSFTQVEVQKYGL